MELTESACVATLLSLAEGRPKTTPRATAPSTATTASPTRRFSIFDLELMLFSLGVLLLALLSGFVVDEMFLTSPEGFWTWCV